jgi:hypothetical protein
MRNASGTMNDELVPTFEKTAHRSRPKPKKMTKILLRRGVEKSRFITRSKSRKRKTTNLNDWLSSIVESEEEDSNNEYSEWVVLEYKKPDAPDEKPPLGWWWWHWLFWRRV